MDSFGRRILSGARPDVGVAVGSLLQPGRCCRADYLRLWSRVSCVGLQVFGEVVSRFSQAIDSDLGGDLSELEVVVLADRRVVQRVLPLAVDIGLPPGLQLSLMRAAVVAVVAVGSAAARSGMSSEP